MSRFEKIKNNLRTKKGQIRKEFGVNQIGLFGSYVRGENTSKSDLDVLVSFKETPGLLKFVRLKNHLSFLAGVDVDLVMKQSLKPYIGKRILKETVYL
jgi:uncharacterized protein